jgi:Holliday junction resolvase
MAMLELKGYYVIRSAGSHQAIDLLAGSLRTRRVFAIQCKTNKARFTGKDLAALVDAAGAFSGAQCVLAQRKGRKRTYTVLNYEDGGAAEDVPESWFD